MEKAKKSFDHERASLQGDIKMLKESNKRQQLDSTREPPSARSSATRPEVTRLLSEKDDKIAQLEHTLEATQQQLRTQHGESNAQVKLLQEKLRHAQTHAEQNMISTDRSYSTTAPGPDASDLKARLVTAEAQAVNALQRAEAAEQAMENSLEENRKALANAYKETSLLQHRLAAREGEEQESERRLQELQIALDRDGRAHV